MSRVSRVSPVVTRGIAVVMTAMLAAPAASAALTSSEKSQIKDFVASARIDDAGRVRSLVARTDLTTAESVGVMVDALSRVPFTDGRAAFMREVLFGGASAASRPLLVQTVVKGTLARADAVYQRYVGGVDHEPAALAELFRIYAFLDADIANAGKPTADAHDPTAGIPASTYEEASSAMREHIDANARWLKGDGAIAETVGRIRAQAQVAFFDMLPDGATRRVDAADRLGHLRGPRRQAILDWGIFIADAGKLEDAKVESVRQLLSRLPGARTDLEVVYTGDERGVLKARRFAMFAGGQVSPAERDPYPFTEEVTRGPFDPAVAFIARDLAVLAAKRALDTRSELRLQAERDAAAARGDIGKLLGRPSAPSVDHVVGAAVQLLLLDAPRAVDLAIARQIAGRPESAALLSDAIGALAVFAPPKGVVVEVGKGGAFTSMTGIRLASNGVATGFTLDGHAFAMDRTAPTFAIGGVRRDERAVKVADLPTVSRK